MALSRMQLASWLSFLAASLDFNFWGFCSKFKEGYRLYLQARAAAEEPTAVKLALLCSQKTSGVVLIGSDLGPNMPHSCYVYIYICTYIFVSFIHMFI